MKVIDILLNEVNKDIGDSFDSLESFGDSIDIKEGLENYKLVLECIEIHKKVEAYNAITDLVYNFEKLAGTIDLEELSKLANK